MREERLGPGRIIIADEDEGSEEREGSDSSITNDLRSMEWGGVWEILDACAPWRSHWAGTYHVVLEVHSMITYCIIIYIFQVPRLYNSSTSDAFCITHSRCHSLLV